MNNIPHLHNERRCVGREVKHYLKRSADDAEPRCADTTFSRSGWTGSARHPTSRRAGAALDGA